MRTTRYRFRAILLAVGVSSWTPFVLIADSPAPELTKVTTSERGSAFVKMVAGGETGVPYAAVYSVSPHGETREAWRAQGWYSHQVFLSDDARFLVRMGPWHDGSRPQPGHLAVAFYCEGKLLKEYSTVDLLKDASKVLVSASHYQWLADDVGRSLPDPEIALRLEEYDKSFCLTTADGWHYTFDLSTGAIRSTRKIDVPVGDWSSNADIARLGVALMLIEFPCDYTQLRRLLGLGRVDSVSGSWSDGVDTRLWAISEPAAPNGFTALEVTIKDYDYKGGPDGAGTGTVTGARLLYVSCAGLRYAFYPPRHLERLVQDFKVANRRGNRTPSEMAAEIMEGMNARLLLDY